MSLLACFAAAVVSFADLHTCIHFSVTDRHISRCAVNVKYSVECKTTKETYLRNMARMPFPNGLVLSSTEKDCLPVFRTSTASFIRHVADSSEMVSSVVKGVNAPYVSQSINLYWT